jgi:hypothetical protein
MEIGKTILKFISETQKTLNSQTILNKKSNVGSITIPDFKLSYRAIVTPCGTGTKVHVDQRNSRGPRNKTTQIKPHDSGQRCQNKCWKYERLFNEWSRATVYSHIEDYK